MSGPLDDAGRIRAARDGLVKKAAQIGVVLIDAVKIEATHVLIVRPRVVHEQGHKLMGALVGHIPDGSDLIELILVIHGGYLLEHRPVEQVVSVDDRLFVHHAGSDVLIVHEELTRDHPIARGGVMQVLLVVLPLIHGIVDGRTRNIEPTHHIAVDLSEPVPVDLGRIRRILEDLRVGGKPLVLDRRLMVAPLGKAPDTARRHKQHDAHDNEEVRYPVGETPTPRGPPSPPILRLPPARARLRQVTGHVRRRQTQLLVQTRQLPVAV